MVSSKPDKGTQFVLSFPLTLAIVPAILITSQDDVFAIPLSMVVETLKISVDKIETIDFNEVIRLRNKTIPLLRLDNILETKKINYTSNKIPIVITEAEESLVGLAVENLIGKREIVIKSLEQTSIELEYISGATILGDGRIALILDIPRLVRNAKTLQEKTKNIYNQSIFNKSKIEKVTRKEMVNNKKISVPPEKISTLPEKILNQFELTTENIELIRKILTIL